MLRRILKKPLAVVLSLCMVVGILPNQVFADGTVTMPIGEMPIKSMQRSITTGEENTIYVNGAVSTVIYPSSKFVATGLTEEALANGTAQLVDSGNNVVASDNDVSISEEDGEEGHFNIDSVTFEVDGLAAGNYTIQYVKDGITYICEDKVVITLDLIINSARVKNLYAGATEFEIDFNFSGFRNESELDYLSFELVDTDDNVIATSSTEYKDFYLSSGNSFNITAKMKVTGDEEISVGGQYFVNIDYTGEQNLINSAGSVEGSVQTVPTPEITDFIVTDANTSEVTLKVANTLDNLTYEIYVRSSSDSNNVYYDESDLKIENGEIEIQLKDGDAITKMSDLDDRFYVRIEYSSGSTSSYFDNPFADFGDYDISFWPYQIKSTADTYHFEANWNDPAISYDGSTDFTIKDNAGNIVGTAVNVETTREHSDYNFKGTINITGDLIDYTTYYVFLGNKRVDTIGTVPDNRIEISTIDISQISYGDNKIFTNLGVNGVIVEAYVPSGNINLIFKEVLEVAPSGENTFGEIVLSVPLGEVIATDENGIKTYRVELTNAMLEPLDGKMVSYGIEQNGQEDFYNYSEYTVDLTYAEPDFKGDWVNYIGRTEDNKVILSTEDDFFRNVDIATFEAFVKEIDIHLEQDYGEKGPLIANVTGVTTSYNEEYNDVSFILTLDVALAYGTTYRAYYDNVELDSHISLNDPNDDESFSIYINNDDAIRGRISVNNVPSDAVFTAKIYKDYELVKDSFELEVSESNLYFSTSVYDGLSVGTYELRVYMDEKLMNAERIFITDYNTPTFVINDYRSYDKNEDSSVVLESEVRIYVTNSADFTYLRVANSADELASETFEKMPSNYLTHTVAEPGTNGYKTIYIEFAEDANGTNSKVYNREVYFYDGEDFGLVDPVDIGGFYNEYGRYTFEIYADVPDAYAYFEIISEKDYSNRFMKFASTGNIVDGKYEYTLMIDNLYNYDDWGVSAVRIFLASAPIYEYYSDVTDNQSIRSEIFEKDFFIGELNRVILTDFDDISDVLMELNENIEELLQENAYESIYDIPYAEFKKIGVLNEVYDKDGSVTLNGYASPDETFDIEYINVEDKTDTGSVSVTTASSGKFTAKITGLEEGAYWISADDGTYTNTMYEVLVIDTVAPTLDAMTFDFGTNDSATINWTTDDTDIETFAIYQILDGETSREFVASYESDVRSATVTASDNDGTTFIIVATDYAGNTAEVSKNTADSIAPEITSLTPQTSTTPVGGSDIALSVTATDNIGLLNLKFEYAQKPDSGDPVYTTIGTLPVSNSAKEATFGHDWDASDLTSGTYLIRATATDIRNNTDAETIEITIDNTPPEAISNENFSVTGTSRYIYVNWTYANTTESITFNVYRSEEADDGFTKVRSTDSLGYFDDGNSIDNDTLYYYYVTVSDSFGNESEPTETKSAKMFEDDESPTIGDMIPRDNQEITYQTNIMLTSADNYRVEKAKLYYRADGNTEWTDITTLEGSDTNNYTFSYLWNVSALTPGTYEIKAEVYDSTILEVLEDGYKPNDPAVLTRTVTVSEYTPPLTPILSGEGLFKSAKLTWTFENTSTTDRFQILADGEVITSVQKTTRSIIIDDVLESTDYKIRVVDTFGGYTESGSINVTPILVDSENPVADIKSNTVMGAVGVPITFTGVNSTDNDEIASYSWNIDGATYNEAVVTHTFTSVGTKNVSLTVTDLSGNTDTTSTTIEVVEVSANSSDVLSTFTVVDSAVSGTPVVKDALVIISSTVGEGESGYFETIITSGEDGRVATVLPEGQVNISVAAEGYKPRNYTKTISNTGDGTFTDILGIPSVEVVVGSISVKEMTLDEIIDAGIDTNNPDNNHVTQFSTTFGFSDGTTIPVTTHVNEAGMLAKQEEFWSGGYGVIPVSEKFYLVIYGEARWLKEMYNVELLVINNDQVDSLTEVIAEIEIPNGLSLADMTETPQTNKVDLGSISPNSEDKAVWFVRGDEAGEYHITASLKGYLGSESFYQSYTTQKPIEVLAGNALEIEVKYDTYAVLGEDYTVEYTIKNVSDKSIYNLLFMLTGSETYKVTQFGDEVITTPLTKNDFVNGRSISELEPDESMTIKFVANDLFQNAGVFNRLLMVEDVFATTLGGSTTAIPITFNPNNNSMSYFEEEIYRSEEALFVGESNQVVNSEIPLYSTKEYSYISNTNARATVTFDEKLVVTLDGVVQKSGFTISSFDSIIVEAIGLGNATLTAVFDGKTYTANYTVTGTEITIGGIEIVEPTSSVAVPKASENDATYAFDFSLQDTEGNPVSKYFAGLEWSIEGEDTNGLSVEKGILTIDQSAKAGNYEVTAKSDEVTDTVSITLTKETPVADSIKITRDGIVLESDTLVIPTGDSEVTYTYDAEVYDQYGEEIDSEVTFQNGEIVLTKDTALTDQTVTATVNSNTSITTSITIKITNINVDFTDVDTAISGAVYTYGDKNSKALIPENGSATVGDTTLNGIFSYVNEDEIQDAGERSITVNFKVTSEGEYKDVVISKTYDISINQLEAIIVWNGEIFIYNGNSQAPTATVSNKVGNDVVAVTVTGGEISAGNHTATAYSLDDENYKLSDPKPTKAFEIEKADSALENIQISNSTIVYGDVFQVTFTPEISSKSKTRTVAPPKSATLYYGDIALDTLPNIVEGTDVTFTIDTKDNEIPASAFDGTSKLFIVSYGGDDNLSDTTATVSATLSKKALLIESVVATSRDYEKENTNVLVNVTLNDDDLVQGEDYQVTATMDDDSAGNDKSVDVTITLTNDYYTLVVEETETTVNIEKIEYDGIKTVEVLAKYGTDGKFDISAWKDLEGFAIDAYDDNENDIIEDFEFLGDILMIALYDSVDNVGKKGAINITISSKNYQDFDIVVNVEVTDKNVPTLYVENFEKDYDGNVVTLADIEKTAMFDDEVVVGEWSFKENYELKNVADSKNITLIFTPEDAENYANGEITVNVSIEKAEVLVKAEDKSITRGNDLPIFTVTYTGFIGEENENNQALETLAVAKTEADGETAGSFDIIFEILAALNDTIGANYELSHETGTLTIIAQSTPRPPSDGGSDSGSSGGDSSTGGEDTSAPNTDNGVTTGNTEIESELDGVTAKAEVDKDDFEDLIDTIIAESDEENATPTIEIDVEVDDNAEGLALTIPTDKLADLAENDDATLTIKSDVAEVTFNADTLNSLAENSNGEITITVTTAEKDDLNERQQSVVGDRPIYDLTIKSGDDFITDFDGGLATIKLPYELKAGENPVGIVVYYIDDMGNLQKVTTMYDVSSKSIIFTTNHFSIYMISYETVNFEDVLMSDWYFDAVMYAVENGIFNGVSDTEFAPNDKATRAMIWTVLARTYGVDTNGDVWYQAGLDWAVQNEISDGTNPMDSITREQFITMLYRYYAPEMATTATVLGQYEDANDISEWAIPAMEWAVANGIISGETETTLAPKDTATRAEIAMILMRISE